MLKKKIKSSIYNSLLYLKFILLWLLNNFGLFYKLEWNYTADSHSLDFKVNYYVTLRKLFYFYQIFSFMYWTNNFFFNFTFLLLTYFTYFEILHYLLYNLNFIMYSTEFPFCDYFTNYFFLLTLSFKRVLLFSWMFKCIIFFYLKNILYSICLPHLPI